jgi:hypothetical protein
VAQVSTSRHAVPTKKEIADMTQGVETDARSRLLIAD